MPHGTWRGDSNSGHQWEGWTWNVVLACKQQVSSEQRPHLDGSFFSQGWGGMVGYLSHKECFMERAGLVEDEDVMG